MINAAFHRSLHGLLLKQLSLSAEVMRAEIAFCEPAHAILPHLVYASATVNPNEASGGIPRHDADVLPPQVASVQPSRAPSRPSRQFRHAEKYTRNRTVIIGDAAQCIRSQDKVPISGSGTQQGLRSA